MLIDVATGMIVWSAGKPDQELPATAACLADEARAAQSALTAGAPAGRPADDLVEITTVTGSRLFLSRMLQRGPSAGLLLFVDVERAKSNLGLASRQVSQLAPAVLG